ncbi:MAG: AbrB/MazE/SpoVT family DNA-binding domain-containing protein [Ligilactobacillus animalis]|uniref:AbrB/MazE/SpoVT family DNA-binding domain-containing protein n=1 Tax=Ligilactobacillus animalis TaxID=1605 RepID=UPI00242C5579|nr:AbrB/MazE/SpoVT family DNA-binding domain-containing protein [Ligilactobacillus animalis]MCI5943057.1 AbrB/MazE/SpoVT family DNA-binding domain-containing protein [Ligilactobacillus animalis]MDY2992702.1 AbrB/MazE/SpoVT family DNA-binding domain-containing protein [Ligilactobacillus animalis]
MGNELVYLDTYVLQQDMKIRLPKTILQNMNVEKGETHFDIYLNREDQSLILEPTKKRSMNDTAI